MDTLSLRIHRCGTVKLPHVYSLGSYKAYIHMRCCLHIYVYGLVNIKRRLHEKVTSMMCVIDMCIRAWCLKCNWSGFTYLQFYIDYNNWDLQRAHRCLLVEDFSYSSRFSQYVLIIISHYIVTVSYFKYNIGFYIVLWPRYYIGLGIKFEIHMFGSDRMEPYLQPTWIYNIRKFNYFQYI